MRYFLIFFVIGLTIVPSLQNVSGQEEPAISSSAPLPTKGFEPDGQLHEVPFKDLSSTAVMPLGEAALSIHSSDWKHAETENFIYHFFHPYIAAPVAVEAEFYYRVIAKELGKDTSHWERKAQIFIFESPTDWQAFQTKGHLDPWTGGVHASNELFIQRNPSFKFKGNTLGHEISHLVFNRFYGDNVPLWLNEGYAEYISINSYAAFYRARGYQAKPRNQQLEISEFIPLTELTNYVTYPKDSTKVSTFYIESENLVRFLNKTDSQSFLNLLDLLSKGSQFETALSSSFSTHFSSIQALEDEFKKSLAQSTKSN